LINFQVFTACGDSNSRCFDAKSGALRRTFKGHTGAVNCLRVVDKRLFTGSFDGSLKVWDISDLEAEKAGGTEDDKKKKKKDEEEFEEELPPEPENERETA
jgi:WD40 repeat protein